MCASLPCPKDSGSAARPPWPSPGHLAAVDGGTGGVTAHRSSPSALVAEETRGQAVAGAHGRPVRELELATRARTGCAHFPATCRPAGGPSSKWTRVEELVKTFLSSFRLLFPYLTCPLRCFLTVTSQVFFWLRSSVMLF